MRDPRAGPPATDWVFRLIQGGRKNTPKDAVLDFSKHEVVERFAGLGRTTAGGFCLTCGSELHDGSCEECRSNS